MDAIALPRIGDAVVERARRGSVVALVAAGHAGELVADELRRSLGATVVRVARTDTGRPGSLATRLDEARSAGAARAGGRPAPDVPLDVVVDAQWADTDSLDRLLESVEPTLGLDPGTDVDADPGRRTLVLISRPGGVPRPLARLQQLARRADLLVELGPTTVDDLVAAGIEPMRAADLLASTGGQADLLDAALLDGSLGPEVARRLSVVDDAGRRAAELLAFGGTLDDVGAGGDAMMADDHDALVRALVDEGLVAPDRTMVPGVAAAVREVATPARRAQAIAALLAVERPGVLDDLGDLLGRLGDRTPAAGSVHLELARRYAAYDPARALVSAGRARDCGADDPELALLDAVASLAVGDPRRALRVLGPSAASETDPSTELVRAAAWSALGDLDAAGPALDRSELPGLAAWARLGAGDPEVSAPPATPGAQRASTTVDALVAGLAHWRDGDLAGADEQLRLAVRRFAVEPSAERWPVTPNVVAAMVAARRGELADAARTVNDAVADRRGGPPHHRAHVLVSAWLAARQGHLDDAATALASLAGAQLTPQEELWRTATTCAIAVRDASGDGLARCAAEAAEAVRAVGTHLYDLDVMVDIAAASARLAADRTDRDAADTPEHDIDGPTGGDPLAAIGQAVERLGSPPTFRFDLAWARLRAALATDDLVRIRARAADLLALDSAPQADIVAAARLLVETGPVDPADVERVARDLARIGCGFEAARLCGVIALDHDDEGATRRLLKESRTWRSKRAQLKTTGHVDRSVVRLSEQEAKVAELVLDGLTHKQIGSALFISAKTVEHHVAHIRTKLGAGSRAELLAAIRAYLGAEPPAGSIPS